MKDEFIDQLTKFLEKKSNHRIPSSESIIGEDPFWDFYQGLQHLEAEKAEVKLRLLKNACGDPVSFSLEKSDYEKEVELLEREMGLYNDAIDFLSTEIQKSDYLDKTSELRNKLEDKLDLLKRDFSRKAGGGNYFFYKVLSNIPTSLIAPYEKWEQAINKYGCTTNELKKAEKEYIKAIQYFLTREYGEIGFVPILKRLKTISHDDNISPVSIDQTSDISRRFNWNLGLRGKIEGECSIEKPFYYVNFEGKFVVPRKNSEVFETSLCHLMIAQDCLDIERKNIVVSAFLPEKYIRGYEEIPEKISEMVKPSSDVEIYSVNFITGSFDKKNLESLTNL